MREITHGTVHAYENRGCRCEECSQVRARYRAERWAANPDLRVADRERRRRWANDHPLDEATRAARNERARERYRAAHPERERSPKGYLPHSTASGYEHHRCRCTPCRDAARAARLARKERQARVEKD